MKLVIKSSQGNDYFSNKVDTGNVMEQGTEELPLTNKKKHGSVRASAALVEDPGLTAGTHMVVDNHS